MLASRVSGPGQPMNGASPNVNTPPSPVASQYPRPLRVLTMPRTGSRNTLPVAPPSGAASPKWKTDPSAAAIQ